MKKIVILGAGVTGLSLGQMLKGKASVLILEKEDRIGGIAKTKLIDGATYHTVGGHCFNSKHPQIMEFVFSLLPRDEWHKTSRFSRINFGNYEVDYPIEFSIGQIFEKDPDFAYKTTLDFLKSEDTGNYLNLEDWFRQKFGNELCDRYFIPYNSKIWGNEPKNMDYKWVQDKLPIPDKRGFFNALMRPETDTMPHSSFYYPNTNNQASLIEALAKDLEIKTSTSVESLRRKDNKWVINDSIEADVVVSTIPLNLLPSYIVGAPAEVLEQASKLRYNKVSNVFWKSRLTDKTWTYQPRRESIFHRYIHIGSFFKPSEGYTITECVGEHSYDEMVECGLKDPFLIKPLDYNVSEHAYVVFDGNRDKAVKTVSDYLDSIGIRSIGRFGRWEYFNMDICMLDSMNTAKEIIKTL